MTRELETRKQITYIMSAALMQAIGAVAEDRFVKKLK